jgi:hypothetical protein
MKRNLFTTLFTFVLVAAFTSSAFAGSGTFTIVEDTQLHGKELKAGNYTVKWNDSGEARILQGNKEIMTAQGRFEEKVDRSSYNGVVKKVDADGTSRVLELRFAGKKKALVFEGDNVAKK